MSLKADALGTLIYAALLAYGLAFALAAGGRKRQGNALFATGFLLAAAAVAFRWVQVAHVPLQSLFEVFLALGMLAYPFALLCRRLFKADTLTADVAMGFVLLWPAAFVFDSGPRPLPPALQSVWFLPHVTAYVAGYVALTQAALQAVPLLFRRGFADPAGAAEREQLAYRMACLGFPLLTIGLLLGAWWAKQAWGDFWQWDPKEMGHWRRGWSTPGISTFAPRSAAATSASTPRCW